MSRTKAPAVELDPRRVVAWRLARQRIDPVAPAGKLERVATELVGIQAQVGSAAELALALRVRNGRIGRTAKALADRRLVRSWAMRGTLHLFAAEDFPVVVAALRSREETWRDPVWLRYFGVKLTEMETAIETIGDVLGDGRPRSRAELAEELAGRLGPKAGELVRGSWGTFLKPAAYRGLLCQAPGDGGGVTFVRPDRWLRSWRTEDPDAALTDVIRRYLAAYGPASPAEIGRWWGARKLMRPVMTALEDELTEVAVDGHKGLVLTVDLARIQRTRPFDGTARLLGPFDPLTIGAGLREALIPKAHLKRVSRTAGWISPVVLIDGRAAGVWTTDRDRSGLRVTVDPFGRLDKGHRAAIERETERLGEIHGLEPRLAFGPVFGGPTAATAPSDGQG